MAKNKTIKDLLQAPKGMRDFMGDAFYERQGFFEKAQEISEYYGFSGIEVPLLEHTEVFTKGVGDNTDIVEKEMYIINTKGGDSLAMRPEGTAGIMRSYIEHGMGRLPQPLFFYYYGPFFRHERPQKGRYRQFYQFGLEIMGSGEALLDALTIQTGYQILIETGLPITVKINSLGNTQVRAAYLNDLKKFYITHKNKLDIQDQERMHTNPLRILDSKNPKTILVNQHAPTLISSLDSHSSLHFNTVLSYLDAAQIPYEIDHSLVRGLDYYAHTVFEYITYQAKGEKSLALGGGGRYDGLAETMGHTKQVPAVGLGLGVDRILEVSTQRFSPYIKQKPLFFFIQIGYEAKAKSVDIIEIFRGQKIPLHHALSKSKKDLGKQLSIAEGLSIPYALIYGEQEVLDKTIIVRTMHTRTQTVVTIDELPKYIQTLI